MTQPIHESSIPFEEIDAVIQKIYPVVADEPAPVVIAAMICMVVMGMNPGADPDVLIKQIEETSQFITMNILTPADSKEVLN